MDEKLSIASVAERFRNGEDVPIRDTFSFEEERQNRPPRFVSVVTDYRNGVPVDDIVDTYECSKGTVLRYARIAGLPKRDKSKGVRSEIIDMYRTGMPIATIASLLDVSQALVSRTATSAGIGRRKFKPRDRKEG